MHTDLDFDTAPTLLYRIQKILLQEETEEKGGCPNQTFSLQKNKTKNLIKRNSSATAPPFLTSPFAPVQKSKFLTSELDKRHLPLFTPLRYTNLT